MTENKSNSSNLVVDIEIKNEKELGTLVNGYNRNQILSLNHKGSISNKIPNLTYYEFAAKGRQILNIDRLNFTYQQIEKVIKEIFTCSFCMDIFNEPVNIKNCLHKFCKKCIENYTRTTKKECIICREKIETKRLLRNDEKIKTISKFNSKVSSIIPNVSDYSKATDKYFEKNLKNYKMDEKKIRKIKEEHLKSAENHVKKETIRSKNNLSELIDLSCFIEEVKQDNAVEESIKVNENLRDSNKINDNLSSRGILKTLESNNIRLPNISKDIEINYSDRDYKGNNLDGLILSKKTTRAENQKDLASINEPNKKMKIENEIKQYEILLEDAEKQIKESKNIVGVKLICERDFAFTTFNKLKLYTSEDITLEDFSLYILSKRNLHFNIKDRINFYIYYSGEIINLSKNVSLKQIREIYKMNPENINIYFYFK